MGKVKMVCFDMDGTIANLYAVGNWLHKLRAEDAEPYREAMPMWDMSRLRKVLYRLQEQGIEVRVITWLSMNSSPAYKQAVREAKKQWLAEMDFPYNHFHGVAYGATKANSVRDYLREGEEAILIDDNAKVRQGWTLGRTLDPVTVDIIAVLESMLE